MENLQQIKDLFFSDIGKTIIGWLISFIIGYKFGVYKTIIQSQTAQNNANQFQELYLNSYFQDDKIEMKEKNEITTVVQNQKAGNNVNQVQIKGANYVRK